MDFVFGFIGIPHAVFDQVRNRRSHICGDAEFVGRQTKNFNNLSSLKADARFVLADFTKRLRDDHHNVLADTGFALIAVGQVATDAARGLGMPSVLVIGVDWNLVEGTPTEIAISGNRLVDLLADAARSARNVLPPLKKELTQKSNRTPLLLPVRNFKSSLYGDALIQLQDELAAGKEVHEAVSDLSASIAKRHGPRVVGKRPRPCFIDDRRVEWHAPGKARHAFARPEGGHPDDCFLAGARRLGAPYDRAFHYDCRKGRGKLKEVFGRCHFDDKLWIGDPHLNISPNDDIRV